jgi:transcriptional regulator with XRE-family HTH domain
MTTSKCTPGEQLKSIRVRAGLSSREVALQSGRIAARYGNPGYKISHPRLVQIENGATVPSIHKLISLSAIYGTPIRELIALYCDLKASRGFEHQSPQFTQLAHLEQPVAASRSKLRVSLASLETRADAALELEDAWAEVPVPLLDSLKAPRHRYALIGRSEFTMYPLIRPGSIVQVDERDRICRQTRWQTEFDRPIYLIELRSGFLCSWCEIEANRLLSIPHPLSPCSTRQFAYPREAEIVGRVTAVVLRLREAIRDKDRKMRPRADAAEVLSAAATANPSL